jgi:hypothetical protein
MSMQQDFDKWVDLWDKAQVSMPKPQPTKRADSNSFFGMNSVDDDTIDDINRSDAEGWSDVIDRTNALYAPVGDLITEETKKKKKKTKKKKEELTVVDDEDGFGKKLASKIGDKNQFISPNPIHFASVGTDQKLRITPNWTSGDALAALAKLKSMMYDLECEMLTKEAMGSDVESLESRLENMKKQVDALSQKLIPDVKTDVS